MNIKTVRLIPRDLEAVEYTEQDAETIRLWIQGYSTFQEIVRDAKTGRLYLPIEGDTLDIIEYGEFVLHEPGTSNFRSVTPDAFYEFYEEVGNE